MTREDEDAGRVVEDSPMHRNMLALAEAVKLLRGDVEVLRTEVRVVNNKMLMKDTEIQQLQMMFATNTVPRDSGATTE